MIWRRQNAPPWTKQQAPACTACGCSVGAWERPPSPGPFKPSEEESRQLCGSSSLAPLWGAFLCRLAVSVDQSVSCIGRAHYAHSAVVCAPAQSWIEAGGKQCRTPSKTSRYLAPREWRDWRPSRKPWQQVRSQSEQTELDLKKNKETNKQTRTLSADRDWGRRWDDVWSGL